MYLFLMLTKHVCWEGCDVCSHCVSRFMCALLPLENGLRSGTMSLPCCPNMRIQFKEFWSREILSAPHKVFASNVLSTPPPFNNLHKSCTYLQQAAACLWKKENQGGKYSEANLHKVKTNWSGSHGLYSILKWHRYSASNPWPTTTFTSLSL